MSSLESLAVMKKLVGGGGGLACCLSWGASFAGFDASYHSVCSWKAFAELLVASRETETHCGIGSEVQNVSTTEVSST